jgi:hypothetical protein
MLKYLVAAAAFTAMCATPADAQTDPASLPPVETMTCEQMQAEMMVAGQQMNAQLDPEFAVEAQRMQDEATSASNARPSIVGSIGTGIACSLPGVAYACMANQAAQAQNAQAQVAENHARVNAQNDRLNASMAGLDQQRLMAMSDRFTEMQCETPQ